MAKNQKGFTLLEVLLAVTILSIISVAFLSFFPQAMKFNVTNENKITGISTAKEMLVTIQNSPAIKEFIKNVQTRPNDQNTLSKDNPQYAALKLQDNIVDSSDCYVLTKEEDDHKIMIKIFKSPDLQGADTLYKTEIQVEMIEGKKDSNLYGYISLD